MAHPPIPLSLGYHPPSERLVFLLDNEQLSLPGGISFPSPLFTCFCAVDARTLKVDRIAEFCVELLRSGCAYFCAWGPGCERVHDIMDETIIGDDPPESSFTDIMTTWHAGQSLTEALHFFLHATTPYEEHRLSCRSALIIVAANPEWTREIRDILANRLVQQ